MKSASRQIRTVQDLQGMKISTRLLLEIALDKGYDVTYFYSSPSTLSGIARCRKENKEFFLKSTCTALTSSLGVFAAENKALTYSMLTGNGIPTPPTLSRAGDSPVDDEVIAFMRGSGKIVVKPASMNHGDGVTVGVNSIGGLRRAVGYIQDISGGKADILYQKQVDGKEYRFLVVSGKVVAVSHRRPPYVVGDGVLSIRELIERENLNPARGEGHHCVLTRIDIDDVERHNPVGFLDEIPESSTEVTLLSTSNLSRGGEAEDCTDIASDEVKAIAEGAANACFLGIAGVDVISRDITSSSFADHVVIEVNLTPGIRMHEFPSVGKPRRVSRIIFREIERQSSPVGHNRPLMILGQVEKVRVPNTEKLVHARVDTGAKTSAIWASGIVELDGHLKYRLFGEGSNHFSGKYIETSSYDQVVVASSNGATEVRYKVKIPIVLKGRRIMASFTLTDRSSQVYPILIGRNILRGKFAVDPKRGVPMIGLEKSRSMSLQATIKKGGI